MEPIKELFYSGMVIGWISLCNFCIMIDVIFNRSYDLYQIMFLLFAITIFNYFINKLFSISLIKIKYELEDNK